MGILIWQWVDFSKKYHKIRKYASGDAPCQDFYIPNLVDSWSRLCYSSACLCKKTCLLGNIVRLNGGSDSAVLTPALYLAPKQLGRPM
jgi:hypothetical protein